MPTLLWARLASPSPRVLSRPWEARCRGAPLLLKLAVAQGLSVLHPLTSGPLCAARDPVLLCWEDKGFVLGHELCEDSETPLQYSRLEGPLQSRLGASGRCFKHGRNCLVIPHLQRGVQKAQVTRRLPAGVWLPGAPVTHVHIRSTGPRSEAGVLGSPCKPWVPLDVGPLWRVQGPGQEVRPWPAWRNWTPLNLLPCLSVQ